MHKLYFIVGKEAVDIILNNMDSYKIIFMDNIMPIMVSYVVYYIVR